MLSSPFAACRGRAVPRSWDCFWYIYRRGETTPAYSHIGVDTSATLKRQTHVAASLARAAAIEPALP